MLSKTSPRSFYSTLFMRGTDSQHLSLTAQRRFLSFVEADPQSSSFLIYNSGYTTRKIQTWKRTLPWIKPFYAMKSNPITPLIQDVMKCNLGFDCASKGEIQKALNLGINSNNIVYSNPIKEEKDIKFAMRNDILLTTADTLEELQKIQKMQESLKTEMKVLWRISIKEEDSEKLATVFSNKFGDDIKNLQEIKQKFQQIKNMGITLHGIHFHCGSGQHGSSSFKKAVDMARACITIGRQFGHKMEILDLGGGFPAGELNERIISSLQATQNDPLGYQVIAEPGRHFSSNSCSLAVRILGKRVKNNRLCYHVNDGLYHSFNCVLMDGVSFEGQSDQFYQKWNSEKDAVFSNGNGKMEGTFGSLFGMTCDGLDVICKNLQIPEMEVGDWIIVGGMGSYTYGPKSAFNGMQALKKIVAWKGEIEDMQEETRESEKEIGVFRGQKFGVDGKLS